MREDMSQNAFEAIGIGGGWGFDTWNLQAMEMLLLILGLFALGFYDD
jgi:hypothetical protein